jgi:predicted TIM-barrel fold metal-dependent hydrolase
VPTVVNSADSHVIEPAELWLSNLPASLRDRAPQVRRVTRTDKDREYEAIFVDGRAVRYEPPGFQDRMRPPGAFAPTARIGDLDDQGIWAELLFPSIGLWCYLIESADLAYPAARVYNDWLLDTFMRSSPRFLGVAMIPLVNIAAAVDEIRRVAGLGYHAALIPATPPTPYNDERYEAVWAALSQTGVQPCFHVGTGADPMVTRGAGGAIVNYVETFFPIQRSTLSLVASGVFDRHPDLHLLCVEGGASWLPGLMDRMDEAALNHAEWVKPKLSALPSEIVRRHVHATFQHDKSVLLTLAVTGVDAVMWGSDYPHLEGTWPNTRRALDDIFDGVDEDVRAAITGRTLARLLHVVSPA